MSITDAFLLGLFREEMSAHSAVLTDGLLSLERNGASREGIEPLMRAAHSIKGAARVVDLPLVVNIAHEMENLLVAAGNGDHPLDAVTVDVLLGALDWLVGLSVVPDHELPGWTDQHGSEAEEWVSRIGGCQGGGQGAGSHVTMTPESPVASAGPTVAATDPVSEPVSEVPKAAEPKPGAAAAGAPATRESPQLTGPVSESAETAVRIAAEILSQLLAYSADMLLEAHRIEALARDFQAVKRLQRQLISSLRMQSARSVPSVSSCEAMNNGLLQLGTILDQYDQQLADISGRTNFLSERLHNLALRGRMRPFSDGVQGFPRLVRDVARQLGKSVDFELIGQDTLVDRDILGQLEAPLNHLLRNALDHGLESPEIRRDAGKLETGRLVLEARHRSGRLLVSLSDDGAGIDVSALRDKVVRKGLVTAEMAAQLSASELYDFLFLPGMTTRDVVTEISGRGVGLDVVQTMVHACGGSIQVNSEQGQGTRFELYLPVTRSVIRTLRVSVAGQGYALPLARIDRAERLQPGLIQSLNANYFFPAEQGNVALVSARRLLGMQAQDLPLDDLSVVLISSEGRQYALEVDELCGECDLVVRPLDPRLGKVPNLSAVALDEKGQPLLIMDVDDLVRTADRLSGQMQPPRRKPATAMARRAKRILVVDDSITVREVERKLLENGGYDVDVAVDGVDGWNQLTANPYDLIVSDVDMPRMNGIELVTRIKTDPKYIHMPVIIVSYKDREEDRLRGMQAGADYYLTKSSFHDTGLIQAVRELIGEAEDP